MFNGEGIRNPGDLRWFNERDIGPCLVQYIGVKELQTVKIEFERAPGKIFKQIVEVVKELIGGQVIDLAVKILSDPSDVPRVGLGQSWAACRRVSGTEYACGCMC